jgi:hypothetical protein
MLISGRARLRDTLLYILLIFQVAMARSLDQKATALEVEQALSLLQNKLNIETRR